MSRGLSPWGPCSAGGGSLSWPNWFQPCSLLSSLFSLSPSLLVCLCTALRIHSVNFFLHTCVTIFKLFLQKHEITKPALFHLPPFPHTHTHTPYCIVVTGCQYTPLSSPVVSVWQKVHTNTVNGLMVPDRKQLPSLNLSVFVARNSGLPPVPSQSPTIT